MKFNNNISLLFAIVCCCTLIFTGCNKDSIDVKEDVQIENNDPIKVINYGRSTSSKNSAKGQGFTGTSIAVFSNETSYKNYIEDLEVEVENWDDAFLAEWDHLNDEDLNAKEEELGFDSEKPLTDFENQFGLQSLRKKYLQEEETWLSNDVLDPTTDPGFNPLYDFDESELAVMNSLAEIQIGTKIVKKLTKEEFNLVNQELGKSSGTKTAFTIPYEDTYLVIDDSDYDALIDFNNGDSSVVNNDNVTVINNPPVTECKYGREVRDEIGGGSRKFCRTLIKVRRPSLIWNGKVKITSYKKRRLTGWGKWRTNIGVGIEGNVFDDNCSSSPTYINKLKGKKRKRKQKYNWRNKSFDSHKVENEGIKGVYLYNNIVKEVTLEW
ncbi:hypothetical protein [uncultured Algibacter sp.]|uniref:hypothetical protein n=1 Tax=uncultured Algibacter sp. TaxID=298659 RepID=UPI00263651C1|nr:hypothetical protein [uncultured Algibacter sp.]